MVRVDKTDVAAGLLICAIGGWFLYGSFDYRMGTVVRMGPGYLPMVFGAMSVVLGVLITLLAFGRSGGLPQISFRAMASVLMGIAVFGLTLTRAGLVPAVVLTVLISSLGDDRGTSIFARLVLAATTAFVAWFIFVRLLGLAMVAFRMPF